MSEELKIVIRPMTDHDRAFIFSTWLQGAYYDVTESIRPDAAEYFRREKERVAERLAAADTEVRIAGDARDPLWLAGYSVSTGTLLHWIHVKKAFRRQGLATMLAIDARVTQVSALTKLGKLIADKKGLGFEPQPIGADTPIHGGPHGRRDEESPDPKETR